jgi:cbb3-type cytochrome oxidase subunit 1
MTPVDALDTLLLLGLNEEAGRAKTLILERLSFDRDVPVKNFEITIRLLGGLLYLAGMAIMAWNVAKTAAQARPVEALIPVPAHA